MMVGEALAPLLMAAPSPLAALPGESIATIEARQRYRLPVIAICNGAPVLRRDWDRPVGADDTLLFVTLPGGGEDGAKNIFRTVLNIALVLVATYFLGPAGAGLTGWQLGAAVAVAQIGAGYLVNAIIPPQPIGAGGAISYEQGSPTYSLSAQGNQARLLQTIPKLYGRHVLTPDFAAAPYTEFAGNDQMLYQLFSLGLGDYDVESILIEDTELWNNVEGYTGVLEDIEIEIVEPGAPVTLFPTHVMTSVEVGGATLKGPNDVGTWAGPFIANAAGTRAKFLALDFVWPGGAFFARDDGSLGLTTIEILAQSRLINDAGDPLGDWTDLFTNSYNYATRTPQRVSVRVEVQEGRYEVQVKRTNDSALEDDTRTFDAVVWQALRAYLVGSQTFPKIMVLAMRAKATDQLSSLSARRVRTIQTSKLPVWNGEEWSAAVPSRDLFPIVADMLRNDVYGRGLDDDRIALADFHSLQTTWTAHGDKFDGVFDQKKSLMQAVADVLRVGRAQPVIVGKMVSAVRDEKRIAPRAIFTPRNIVRGSLQLDFVMFDDDTPDDVIVEFYDARTWRFNEVRCTLPDSASTNPARISLFGCTDRELAWKHGIYQAAVNKYRRRLPSLQTEFDGRPLRRGDMVLLAHPLPKWGRAYDVEGFLPEDGILALSDSVVLSEEDTNFLRLQKPTGEVWGPVIVDAGEDSQTLIADADDLAAVILEQGDWEDFVTFDGSKEATVAILGSGAAVPRECLLANARSQGDTRVQLALVVDHDAVYTADEAEVPDESEAIILPPTPKKPALSTINIRIGGSRYFPILYASWEPAPGSDRTAVRISYDHITWLPVQDGGQNSYSGAVEATTVWIDFRPLGRVAGDLVERFYDLTISEGPPGPVSGIGITLFAQHAWIDFSLPPEDGVTGIICKIGAEDFDPETEGTIVYSGGTVTRVLVPLDGGPVYARVAAFNVFGKTGLNWSSELLLVPRGIEQGELSSTLSGAIDQIDINATAIATEATTREDADDALASFITTVSAVADDAAAAVVSEATARADGDSAIASSVTTVQAEVDGHTAAIEATAEAVAGIGARYTLKIDVDGNVAGFELANGGAGASALTFLADAFRFVVPGELADTFVTPFEIVGTEVKLLTAIAEKIIVDHLQAHWAEVGTLTAGRIVSADGKMIIDFNDGYIQMDY